MEYNIAEIHDRVFIYLTEELRDQELRFTLRKKNVNKRLNQGYWFIGNDHYLALSFWNGLDWRNKTPNIYFAIKSNGECTLEFVSYDNKRKINFFQNVSEAIGMQQRTRARSGDAFEHWVKNFRGTDYIQALDSFLKKDKKIIDAFIKSEGLEKEFSFISEKEFSKNKSRIDKIRNTIKKEQTYQLEFDKIQSIKLKKIRIENISIFDAHTEIEFNPRITCIIGVNGAGKTSLLRALVLAFTGFEQNETPAVNDNSVLTSEISNLLRITGVEPKGITYPKDGAHVEVFYSIQNNDNQNTKNTNNGLVKPKSINDNVVDLDSNSKIYQNRVNILVNKGLPEVTDDSESDFQNIIDDRYKTLFLAFPQVQGKSLATKSINPKYPHINDAISILNNQPDNRLGQFASWIKDLKTIANAKIANRSLTRNDNPGASTTNSKLNSGDPPEWLLIQEVFQIISKVTGEEISFYPTEENLANNDIWVKIGKVSNPILLNLVSQGFNNVFGWVGYFMKRLVDVTPDGKDFKETSAIVIIDEIDTYLHPAWQTNILAVLCERFPNVQFVTTTHSPYIVGSIPKDKISIYVCKKDGATAFVEPFIDFTPYGADLERLSEKVFGVESRFVKVVREQFEKLEDLIDVGELKKAKAFIDDNFEEIDQEDPEILLRKRLIRAKEILAQ